MAYAPLVMAILLVNMCTYVSLKTSVAKQRSSTAMCTEPSGRASLNAGGRREQKRGWEGEMKKRKEKKKRRE